jgi:4-amino-4-deoxychorismate lyase
MCRLVESIRYENGAFDNMSYHERRMKRSLKEIFGMDMRTALGDFLSIGEKPPTGLYKCRVLYDGNKMSTEFVPYEINPAQNLTCVYDDTISYEHKWEDRSGLLELFNQRNGADDVLIIRNGFVTDTTNANIIFKQDGRWFTPFHYLLRGTMRESLLVNKIIGEKEIRKENIRDYESFKLINAMMRFSDTDEVSINNIR